MAKTEENAIKKSAEDIFNVMEKRVSAEDLLRIKKAYEFAAKAHEGQTRKSGEPYITHPIAVAGIVASELELDANPVIAAFLHDVVEDTNTTIEQICEIFGDDVAHLVDILTKRRKERYENTKQVDNFKQILESVQYDIRALLVKLSDRLHNMRTLSSMTPAKQMKIAGETDFFYAPLAGRLGLYHVKSELENLSFKFRCPNEFEHIDAELEDDKRKSQEAVDNFTERIETILKDAGITARTQVRYRKPYSIWRNMVEAKTDFAHVDFKHYIRVIYSMTKQWSEKDVSLLIYSRLSSHFKERPGSVVNYIDNPKDNGYQSFHVKFLNQYGKWEELHISSERMIRNSQLGCVMERDESWMERVKLKLREIANDENLLFMDSVKSMLYNEDIVAFTPRGKGIILPKDATALDFAYEVHSNIGDHAKYCRINNVLSPLKTILHRGDCVYIGTDENSHPKDEWLSYATSFRAKRKIDDYIKHQPKIEYKRCSECQPLPGDEVIGYKDKDGMTIIHSKHCPVAIRCASENGDAIVDVKFDCKDCFLYPVTLEVLAIDRYHLIQDILECLVEHQHHSLRKFVTTCDESIVTCIIGFSVHSLDELTEARNSILQIEGVDSVNSVSHKE